MRRPPGTSRIAVIMIAAGVFVGTEQLEVRPAP